MTPAGRLASVGGFCSPLSPKSVRCAGFCDSLAQRWNLCETTEVEIRDAMITYLWIAVGGAVGTTARYWLSGVVAGLIGETFPWGTLVINVTGSFIIGFFAVLTGPDGRVYVG